jgi:glyoxylase-like metal-dependent hydrolase (beta-lactamase superfamily II)
MHGKRPQTVEKLQDGLLRVLAGNASAMTCWGTNTYIVGTGRVAVIDPGPADPAHLRQIMAALAPGQSISHILVTHSHLDHSPLAGPLSRETGAPVLAYGDSRAGRSPVMRALAASGLAGGGEGIQHDFRPDQTLADGDLVSGDGWTLQALWTPGHMGNHLSFRWKDAVFTGDHVMGWASSMVSPPDGDLGDYMASCRRLAGLGARVFYPGHGGPISDPRERLNWLVAHRQTRAAAILAALDDTPVSVKTICARVYTDIPAAMQAAARRNVFAQLVEFALKSEIHVVGDLGYSAKFRRR